jgi:membrane protease YdiL (CAAX protease family)
MSAARRFALLLAAASFAIALAATTVLAQGGGPDPSGGTSANPSAAVSATPVAITPATFLSAGFPLEMSVRGWLTSQIATQRFASPIARAAAGRILARRAGR